MEVAFDMTPADVRRAVRHMRMPRRRLFLVIAALNLGGAAISYARRGPDHGIGSVHIFLFTAALFVVCWFVFPAYMARRIGEELELLGATRITITDEGLLHDDPGGCHLAPWSALRRVETTATDVLIFGDGMPILVPQRAFTDDTSRVTFLAELRRRIGSIHT